MDVVYATSDNFIDITAASVASLYATNHHLNPRVWVLGYDVTDANKQKLEVLAQSYQQAPIQWLDATQLPDSLQSDRGSMSQFGRLFLGSLLPESVERVLHLDGDTIVQGPLDNLIASPFEGAIVQAVSDTFNKQYKKVLGIPAQAPMFNPGVMWLDLTAWRRDAVEETILAIIRQFQGKVLQADLGILNAALHDRYKELDPRYNVMTIFYDFSYSAMLTFKQPVHYYSQATLEAAKTQPVIRHYTTCFASKRPWVAGSQVAGVDDFRQYYQGDYQEQAEGLMMRLNRWLPQGLLAPLLGVVQSQLRPRFYRHFK